MKHVILCLFALLISFSVQSGGVKEGKYKKIVKSSNESVSLQDLHAFRVIIKKDPAKAIEPINKLLIRAINANNKEVINKAYVYLGVCYFELKQYELALQFLTMNSDNSFKNPTPDVQQLEYLGYAYSKLGDYQEGTKYLEAAFEWTKDQNQKDQILMSIADNEYAEGNYLKALEHYFNLLQKAQSNQNQRLVKELNFKVAACYVSMDQVQKGMEYYKQSLSDTLLDLTQSSLNSSKNEVSRVLSQKNELLANSEIIKGNNLADNGVENLLLAKSYFRNANFESAIQEVDEFLRNISYDFLSIDEIQVIRDLAIELDRQNQPQKAFNYINTYVSIRDSVAMIQEEFDAKRRELGMKGIQSAVDLEILKKDKEISDNLINHLVEESQLKEESMKNQRYMILILVLALVIGVFSLLYIMKVSKQRRIANQRLAVRSLRSQMNPHFIFNALNSVNSFISINDERAANQFLTSFSKLMRTVMENSEYDFIPLSKEIEILEIYLSLEHFRFKDKFTYKLEVDNSIDEDFGIPPMLIQPFIENAVWHGLRYKQEPGELKVAIDKKGDGLEVIVSDNGIGRKASKEIKTKNQKKNKSVAINNIFERIKIFKSLYNIDINVQIEDLNSDGTGTMVKIIIPSKK